MSTSNTAQQALYGRNTKIVKFTIRSGFCGKKNLRDTVLEDQLNISR